MFCSKIFFFFFRFFPSEIWKNGGEEVYSSGIEMSDASLILYSSAFNMYHLLIPLRFYPGFNFFCVSHWKMFILMCVLLTKWNIYIKRNRSFALLKTVFVLKYLVNS